MSLFFPQHSSQKKSQSKFWRKVKIISETATASTESVSFQQQLNVWIINGIFQDFRVSSLNFKSASPRCFSYKYDIIHFALSVSAHTLTLNFRWLDTFLTDWQMTDKRAPLPKHQHQLLSVISIDVVIGKLAPICFMFWHWMHKSYLERFENFCCSNCLIFFIYLFF